MSNPSLKLIADNLEFALSNKGICIYYGNEMSRNYFVWQFTASKVVYEPFFLYNQHVIKLQCRSHFLLTSIRQIMRNQKEIARCAR